MKRNLMLTAFALPLVLWAAGALKAQVAPDPPTVTFFSSQGATDRAAREDELYNDGTDYLDEGKYQQALEKFGAVAEMKGRRADAALYWKAYAQNKLGRRSEALAVLGELRRRYAQSKWLKDAAALEFEVKSAQGQPVNPASENDCELKVMALNALMNSDEERAITIVENVLRSNTCPKVRDKALFVLSQSDSPRAQQALAGIARGQAHPDLQRSAIENLGLNDTPESKRALVEIYGSTSDPSVKRAVLHAFMSSDAEAETLAVARNEHDPGLRAEAIQQLGAMEAREPLHQMYQAASTTEDKEAIINALSISDDIPFLAQIAKSGGSLEVRRAAIHGLGISDEKARPLLVEIYRGSPDSEIRDAALEGLFINDAAEELIDLAKKETDPQRKLKIVEKLSLMDSPKAKDYMIEIVNR